MVIYIKQKRKSNLFQVQFKFMTDEKIVLGSVLNLHGQTFDNIVANTDCIHDLRIKYYFNPVLLYKFVATHQVLGTRVMFSGCAHLSFSQARTLRNMLSQSYACVPVVFKNDRIIPM